MSELNVTVISTSNNNNLSYDHTSLVTFNVTPSFLPPPSSIASTVNLTVTNSSHHAINTHLSLTNGQSLDTGQPNATTANSTESTSRTLNKSLLGDSDPLLRFTVDDTAIIRDVITNSIGGDDVINTRSSTGAFAKKGHDSSDEDGSDEKSQHKSPNSLLYFLYAVSSLSITTRKNYIIIF